MQYVTLVVDLLSYFSDFVDRCPIFSDYPNLVGQVSDFFLTFRLLQVRLSEFVKSVFPIFFEAMLGSFCGQCGWTLRSLWDYIHRSEGNVRSLWDYSLDCRAHCHAMWTCHIATLMPMFIVIFMSRSLRCCHAYCHAHRHANCKCSLSLPRSLPWPMLIAMLMSMLGGS